MRTVRTTIATGAAAVVLLLLAGCTSNPVAAGATRTAAPTSAASVAPPTPTTAPPTQTVADATPVSVKCKALVPTAVAHALEPGLLVDKGWMPSAGTPVARLEDLHGTTCQWSSETGDVLEVGVAKPGRVDAVALKNDLVERSQSVPTYGGEAYFQVVDHVGQADVFRGRTWVFVRSNRFYEPGDATAIVNAALDELGLSKKPKATATATPTTAAPPAVAPTAAAPAPTETPVG